jgi:hypothetical protein
VPLKLELKTMGMALTACAGKKAVSSRRKEEKQKELVKQLSATQMKGRRQL